MRPDLIDRLRGVHRILITDGLGPVTEGGNPRYFERRFPPSPLQLEAADVIERQATEIIALDLENRRLRAFIAKSDLPCVYCRLPKDDMTKCEHGFPGCARGDDIMLSPDYDPGPIPEPEQR